MDAGAVEWSVGGGLTGAGEPSAPPSTGRGTFIVACGSGFDARVMAAASEAAKRRAGRAAYFAAAASLVPGLTVHPHRIEVDGEAHELMALAVLVVNAGELIPGLIAPRLPISASDEKEIERNRWKARGWRKRKRKRERENKKRERKEKKRRRER